MASSSNSDSDAMEECVPEAGGVTAAALPGPAQIIPLEHFPLTPTEPKSPPVAQSPPWSADPLPTLSPAMWLQAFQTFSCHSQSAALANLISMLGSSPSGHQHILALSAAIKPFIHRNFIVDLPEELAFSILRELSPEQLLVCCQVCRTWKGIIERDALWKEICEKRGLHRTILPAMQRHFGRAQPRIPWKDVFLTGKRVEHAWRTRNPTETELNGHTGRVITCLELLPDGRIISGSDDMTLKVWSANDHVVLRTLRGHTGGVWCCEVQGNLAVSGSTDRSIRVWNIDTGRCEHVLTGHSSTVRCLRVNGNFAVSGSRDTTVRMWDIRRGICAHVFHGHTEAVRCVEYDGRLVVSGSYDCKVRVWDPETETCIHELAGHANRVYSLQFDGRIIASGSLDRTIKIWDAVTGTLQHTLRGHQSLTGLLQLKGNILVSGNADTTLRVWDVNSGLCIHTLEGHQSAVTFMTFDDLFVISCSDDGTVKLWDIQTGAFIRDVVNVAEVDHEEAVWRVQSTSTQLVCAVGGRPDAHALSTKLLHIDFLQAILR